MKVLYIAVECKPFSKVGGVGDVAGELPPELKRQGVDIEIITPLYGTVKNRGALPIDHKYSVDFHGREEPIEIHSGKVDNVPAHLVYNPRYFDGKYQTTYVHSESIPFYDDALRFSFFCFAILPLIRSLKADIIHINDWPLGYLFGWMIMNGFPERRVLTIHNINYQGNIGIASVKDWQMAEILKDPTVGPLFPDPVAAWKSVNPLRLAMETAHQINTVSPQYADEITQPPDAGRHFSGGLQLAPIAARRKASGALHGIINGFNYQVRPSASVIREKLNMKRELISEFPDPERVLFGFVGRAVEQKVGLLFQQLNGKYMIEHLLDEPGINLAMITSGVAEYEQILRQYSKRSNFHLILDFDPDAAARINLGCDFFLMPSLFEPCGITQLEAMQNATPPIVHWTGGLVDTVVSHELEHGTGIGFGGTSQLEIQQDFLNAICLAKDIYLHDPDKYRKLQKHCLATRFTWAESARQYRKYLYSNPVKARLN